MKKRIVIFLVLFLIQSIFITQLLRSETIEDKVEDYNNQIEDYSDKLEEFNDQDKTEYLKQEWTKILEKNPVGRGLIAMSNFVESNLGPLIKIILGVEYSLSWAFVFAVILWFGLFYLFYHPFKAFFENSFFALVGAFAVTCLIGISGVIRGAVDVISTAVDTSFLFWIALLITILILIVLKLMGTKFGKIIEAEKNASSKEKTNRATQTIQTQGKVSGKELDSYK